MGNHLTETLTESHHNQTVDMRTGAPNGMFPSLSNMGGPLDASHGGIKKVMPQNSIGKDEKQRPALKVKNTLNKDKDKKEEVKTSVLGAEIIAKSKQKHIKFNLDEEGCKAKHREMCNGDSLKDKYMINYLAKRYGEEMSKVIVNQLRKPFN